MSSKGSKKAEPRVLAVETGTALLGVALVAGQEVLYETVLHRPRAHSTMLLPLCVEALERVNLVPGDLSCVVTSLGPGSFTGLRIGAATAQGLAVSAGKRVVMVPAFEVLLYQARQFRHVAVTSGRARAQAASAVYSRVRGAVGSGNGFPGRYGFRESVQAGPRDLESLLKEIRRLRVSEVHVTGDASGDLLSLASGGRAGPRLVPVEPYWRLPRPGILGIIGACLYRDGAARDPRNVIPEYFRKSQAEVLAAGKARSTSGESVGEGR